MCTGGVEGKFHALSEHVNFTIGPSFPRAITCSLFFCFLPSFTHYYYSIASFFTSSFALYALYLSQIACHAVGLLSALFRALPTVFHILHSRSWAGPTRTLGSHACWTLLKSSHSFVISQSTWTTPASGCSVVNRCLITQQERFLHRGWLAWSRETLREISGSHGGEDIVLLGSEAVWTRRLLPTLRRNILPLSSALHPWRWRQCVSPERWYLPTSSHGFKTQKKSHPRNYEMCVQNFSSKAWVHGWILDIIGSG
jgi:hypothetical protein